MTNLPRLLVISSNNRTGNFISNAIKKNVKIAVYKYENSTLDDILASIIAELGGIKVNSVAFMLHGDDSNLFLAGSDNTNLNHKMLIQNNNIKEFFLCLSSTFMNINQVDSRIDFFDCSIKSDAEVQKICQELIKLVHCSVSMAHDLNGPIIKRPYISENNRNLSKTMPVGELYFESEKLYEILNSSIQSEKISGYEMMRVVGKGAFGTAVLYRKKDDDSLVIVKKINMHDLTAAERQLAMNEVSVLSMFDHENIVSYYDSFEMDGVLMIEMEYADGGTLAQYLAELKVPLEEYEVLSLFKQIVSAIKHMHQNNILHRDLKTANIFLTKEGIVKVGDFGISKMLTTRQGGALTVVGTPYYISPEMCEGKLYNQKSDIWALGCILYEMVCQQKTFEGSNLPALVNKIVKGQFAPVRGNYSQGLKQLIRDLLQRDPDFRPTSSEILDEKLPFLLKEDVLMKENDDSEISMDPKFLGQTSNKKNSLKQSLRSVLYDIKMNETDISLTSVPLPPSIKIKEVALSSSHMIALTSELMVYTWGNGGKGQLGHGKIGTWMEKPFCVDALKGKNISRICAGEGFSIFSSDNGIVMTCGSGFHGCLGHGDWNMCLKPKLIEKLLSVDVVAVNCGPQHVVIVGGEGEAYAWGSGSGGRLGTGTEENCCTPTEVKFSNDIKVVQAYCGYDGTMFVTESGDLLACGRNQFNKLGLNEHKGFLSQMKQFIVSKAEIEKQLVPMKLKWLRQPAVTVSMGANHTAVLVEPGKIFTFGSNKSGQLGRGNQRMHSTPFLVKSITGHTITMVECGDTFTIAGTAENSIYFWGSRRVLASDHIVCKSKLNNKTKHKKSNDMEVISEVSETSISEVIKIGESNSPLMKEIERIGPDSPIIQVKTPDAQYGDLSDSTAMDFVEEETIDHLINSHTERKDIILQPREILALYASLAQIAKGEIVKLMNLYCFGMKVYLVVDTTAPLPRRHNEKAKPAHDIPVTISPIQKIPVMNYKYDDIPEEDSLGPIPDWLKRELANATTAKDNTLPKPENLTGALVMQKQSWNTKHLNNHLSDHMGNNKLNKNKQYVDNTLKKELEKLLLEKKNTEEKLRKMEEKLAIQNNDGYGCSLHNNAGREREKELEEEIMRLREQLNSINSNNDINKVYDKDDLFVKQRITSKENLWSQKKSSKLKSKSKICIIQ